VIGGTSANLDTLIVTLLGCGAGTALLVARDRRGDQGEVSEAGDPA
jgi:hypothetical protein